MTTLLDETFTTFLQQVAQAVSTVLQFDVTVADKSLARVAGTGRYLALVGQPVPSSSSFAEVMRTGKPRLILEPRHDPACRECEARENCSESCHVSFPLVLDGQPLGVLALIGFTEEQRRRLAEQGPVYLAFIEQMARLVESAARSTRITRELKEARDQLRGVVEAVREGIVAVDADGNIICCNQAAARILRLDGLDPIGKKLADFFPDAPMLQVLSTGTGYTNREVTLSSPAGTLRHVSTATPLFSNGRVVGAVALLKTLEDVHRIAYEISESQPDRPIDHILGQAPLLQEAKQMALRAASSSASVLLIGESGTGKELFARAIHYHSARGSGPFVAVDCAAVPEDLLESELFGYEEGAFTGARKGGKPGKFELAHGGTLFLDEVGDCSLRLQAKLLRALDRGEIERVGGTRTIRVDVRLVAATNKDLEQMVRNGEFREDLYFRLNVIPIRIPPLRNRKVDILPLFRHFLDKHASRMGRETPSVSPDTEQILQDYWWPGNVRELENVAQYVLHTCAERLVEPRHLPPRLIAPGRYDGPLAPARSRSAPEEERKFIAEGLRRLGKTPHAKDILARQLGVSRATIYRKIKKYGLD